MPDEINRLPSPPAPLRLWLGLVVVVFLCNAAAFFYLEHYTSQWGNYLHWRKWELLFDTNRPVDWLVLGDSSGSLGVVAEDLGLALDGYALNLCTTAGGTLLDDLWLLDSYIRRHGKPQNVVIVHTFSAWNKMPNIEAVARAPLFWLWRQDIRPSPFIGLGTANIFAFVMKYFPLYNRSAALADILLYPWRHDWFHQGLEERFSSAGTLSIAASNPEAVLEQTKQLLRSYSGSPRKAAAFNLDCFRRIISLAEKHDFPVYIANGPLFERLAHNRAIRSQMTDLRRSLATLIPPYAPVQMILTQAPPFPLASLADNVDHLIPPAAKHYTALLAAAIRHAAEDH
jgi:hypothetical protein